MKVVFKKPPAFTARSVRPLRCGYTTHQLEMLPREVVEALEAAGAEAALTEEYSRVAEHYADAVQARAGQHGGD